MQYVWHWRLKPLLMTVFHLARNSNHKICLLSMLCEGIMREDSVEMVLVLILCGFETSWAAQPETHVHANCDFVSPHLAPVAGILFDSGGAVAVQ